MRIMSRASCRAMALTIMAVSLSTGRPGAAKADDVADFYRGKTIQYIVGSAAGTGYDITSRPLARYLTKHLPGNPVIVVRNMPGAAGVIMR